MKKKILIGLLAVVMCFTLTGCGEDKTNNGGNDSNGDNQQQEQGGTTVQERIDGDPVSAFKQFGVDVESIKPNLATVNENANKTLNVTIGANDLKYSMTAGYMEKVLTGSISEEKREAYIQTVFDYTKSISDDNKNHVPSGNSNYTDEQTTATIKDYQWSFINKGTYVDVYVTAYSETEVGVKMAYGTQH